MPAQLPAFSPSCPQDFSGTLEVNELIKAAKEVLPDLTDEEIRRMFTALDSDQTGTVDVHEFFAGLLSSMSEDKLASLAQKSFTMLDRCGVQALSPLARVHIQ